MPEDVLLATHSGNPGGGCIGKGPYQKSSHVRWGKPIADDNGKATREEIRVQRNRGEDQVAECARVSPCCNKTRTLERKFHTREEVVFKGGIQFQEEETVDMLPDDREGRYLMMRRSTAAHRAALGALLECIRDREERRLGVWAGNDLQTKRELKAVRKSTQKEK